MKKYEYKYRIPVEMLSELHKLINPYVEKDAYMNEGGPSGYTVRSIYFDSPQYDYYHEKESGIKVRKKIRIRGYNNQNPENTVFLEIKRKNEKQIYKNRAPVAFHNLKNFISSGNAEKYIRTDTGLNNTIEDSQRFLFHIHKSHLHPLVLVIYEREAYSGKYDHTLRITFDKNLRSSIHPEFDNLYDERNIKYSLPSFFIFEVKFITVFPSWLKLIIKSLKLKLESTSKFSLCIDEHDVVSNHSLQPKLNYIRTIHF